MLINYVPRDECRIAITRDGLLEELWSERLNALSHVGNIYAGRVVNVESSIQAAFIDFGLEQNGFLHITDLHPRYFPGEDDETTERVGKKTPRRERPPIQAALKRGQEIMVQVIKEGIGTKGPTLTSYLSIPGRFLVMMPDMDRVGVSRKVEDDEQRREARKVLDQLDLPEGFGFILRTAGIDRGKMELKRDLAYLQRLWKDMERRRKSGSRPRLLYTESDLLVRTLRDALTSEIDEIVIDDANALGRAGRFLKIAAPRSGVKLSHYDKQTPLFHAFGVEKQIEQIHKRDAPLKSGGRLVIDETEALVAIDVNSGKMRNHSDAEMTAFKTNMEAADEICRQLKLRDLGGLVVLDLIDMRSKSHRREVETKFKNLFKRDRARTKVLPISQLGLLELTRQRMRGSLQSAHFSNCRVCEGSGLVQRPESVAGDAVRDLATVLAHDVVRRAEMVVSPRVAGELLSSKRKLLGRLERDSDKRIDVRVSETIPLDQVTIYAYDDRGADIDVERLPEPKEPTSLQPWEGAGPKGDDWGDNWAIDPSEEEIPESYEDLEEEPEDIDESDLNDGEPSEGDRSKKKRRRRRRRRRKGDGESSSDSSGEQRDSADRDDDHADDEDEAPSNGQHNAGERTDAQDEPGDQPRKRKRRRRRRRRKGDDAGVNGTGSSDGAIEREGAEQDDGHEERDERTAEDGGATNEGGEAGESGGASKKRRRRRRRGGRGRGGKGPRQIEGESNDPTGQADEAPSGEATDAAPVKEDKAAPEPKAEEKVEDSAPAKKKTTRKKAKTSASKKKTAKKTTKKKTAKKSTRKKAATRSKKKTSTSAEAPEPAEATDAE